MLRAAVASWCGVAAALLCCGRAATTLSNLRPLAPLYPDGGPEALQGRLEDHKPSAQRGDHEPSAEDYEKALQAGMSRARALLLREREKDGSQAYMSRVQISGLRNFAFKKPQRATKAISSCRGRLLLESSISYLERFRISPSQAIDSLEEVNALLREDTCRRVVIPECEEGAGALLPELRTIQCNSSLPYRTIDGTCNNVIHTSWGAARRPFVRLLDPEYEDRVSEPRGAGRTSIPSPRSVSVRLHSAGARPALQRPSLMVMQWGQFLDHDLVLTPEASCMSSDGEPTPIPCCEDGINDTSDESEDPGRDCRPIPTTDDFSQQHGRSCMRFVRSMVASRGCMLGPREQMSQATSYIDGSAVYGTSEEEARTLRTMSGGNLNTSSIPNPHFMAFPSEQAARPKPGSSRNSLLSYLPTHPCEPEIEDGVCFLAGDERVNEQPGLTSMHTLWLRVHQNVVQRLAALNPTWDDETLYQEARRVVGALIQQITYREFLPVVLGKTLMKRYNLQVSRSAENSYYQSVDATIANVFGAAAFRFGHTLVREVLLGAGDREVSLADSFFNAEALVKNGTTPTHLLEGLTRAQLQPVDPFLTPTLIQRLFVFNNESIGLDLMALNIQRGRDHGLPPYVAWRQKCGLPAPSSFADLVRIMPQQYVDAFQDTYSKVEDIDLFPAALAEEAFQGSLLGPTFSCILGQQFSNLKMGDRFWYQNTEQPKPFSSRQLGGMRRVKLAGIMCEHLSLDSIQPNVFLASSVPRNGLRPCSSIRQLNLRPWRELRE